MAINKVTSKQIYFLGLVGKILHFFGFLALIFFIATPLAFADAGGYIATGSILSNVNGTYCPNGTNNGNTSYYNGTYYLSVGSEPSWYYWVVGSAEGQDADTSLIFDNESISNSYPLSNIGSSDHWSYPGNGLIDPNVTFAVTSCGSPPPGGGTSTIASGLGNIGGATAGTIGSILLNGLEKVLIVLACLMGLGILVYYVKRLIGGKKKSIAGHGK
jgi:hypothetical protein